ncbi:MAG TPA: glycoside hydrolase family 3 protein [Terriglobales bacterium]|nr:glycoside hydrolase family 3 protein [Terriglobales bacterium]
MIRKTGLVLLLMFALASLASAKDKYLEARPIKLDRGGEKWAEKTLKKMSLEEKIGQMIMVWTRGEFVNVNSQQYIQYRDRMHKYHLGGFGFTVPVQLGFLIKSEPYEAAALTNQLQRDSKLPLMFAADFERGLSMRLDGGTAFPHAMAFGAAGNLKYAEEFGRVTAEESRAIGIHWNWFPDADVNSNPLNPIINTRAFGGDPKQVSDMVVAYIKGARQAGMLTTAKHFPGHGDTATDSHLGLASVTGDRLRLDTVELPPFKAAVDAGVDSVMVAHLTMPALDNGPDRVATNSPVIVNDLLKKQMGFKGLVVTDALDMNGLMRIYSKVPGVNPSGAAAVATVKAGNDMVLIPGDVDGAYNGLLNAVKSGEIPQKQIDESVLKILKAKASVGLHKARLVDLNTLNRKVADPKNVAIAQQVADDAVTLVRDNGKVLPIKPTPRPGTNGYVNAYELVQTAANRVLAVIFTDDVRSDWGRQFERQLRQRVPDVRVMYVDSEIGPLMAESINKAAAEAQAVIAAVYAVPSAGKKINDPTAVLNSLLAQSGDKTVVVAMGNPYVAAKFPGVQNYICTFSNSVTSEGSAVRALFGEIPIRGHLPVPIPAVADRGFGIERSAQAALGGTNVPDIKGNANP